MCPWPEPSVYSDMFCTLDSPRHPLRPYLEYVGHLYQKLEPLPEQERFEVFILTYVCNIGMPLLPLSSLDFQLYLSAWIQGLFTVTFASKYYLS